MYVRICSVKWQYSFSIGAPSIWNSLSYNCQSAELLSIFERTLKLSRVTLLTVNVNVLSSPCHYAPPQVHLPKRALTRHCVAVVPRS